MTPKDRYRGHVLVVGCGYVGQALARLLVADGHRVTGLKRHPTGLPEGVEPLAGDVLVQATLDRLPPRVDAVVYAVSPAERSGTAYRNAYVDGLRNVIRATGSGEDPFRGRLVLVSSTGAFGQTDGARVDEGTPPEPAGETGAALLAGESLVHAFEGTGVVLRLGGIYGPGRDRTVRRIADGSARCPEPDRYGNRIHRDDAAGATRHLLNLEDPARLYLGVDRDPAQLREVYGWVAEQLGAPDPCAGSENAGAPDSRPTGSKSRSNKRCSSDRLVASGFRFAFPTFREGYRPLIEALSQDL
jgi:nucleoside-diphosphate-sugar epimerase